MSGVNNVILYKKIEKKMCKNNSYVSRKELSQCIKLNRDNTKKLKIQVGNRLKIYICICMHVRNQKYEMNSMT